MLPRRRAVRDSILLAAELWRLTPLQATGMVLTYLDEYRAPVTGPLLARDVDGGRGSREGADLGECRKNRLGDQQELLTPNRTPQERHAADGEVPQPAPGGSRPSARRR